MMSARSENARERSTTPTGLTPVEEMTPRKHAVRKWQYHRDPTDAIKLGGIPPVY